MNIGMVGLGIMGSAISGSLVKAGHAITGCDIDPVKRQALEEAGGTAVETVGEVVAACPVVLSALPSVGALEAVVAEICDAAPAAECTLIELSTLPIDTKQSARTRLQEVGVAMIDCPMSGTGSQAATGDLALFVSGEPELCAKYSEVFDGFSRVHHYVGPFGNGSKMKFVANLLVGIHNVATAEALLLARQAGLDVEETLRVVSSGAGNSRIFELRGPLMAEEKFTPAMIMMKVWQKDVDLISEFAEELGTPTPLFAATRPLYEAALEAGYGDEDSAAVYKVLRSAVRK
jgi:3-hydroxyisobutyrate dehydrogenase-like beta-hydroxyacid dehydrogenase